MDCFICPVCRQTLHREGNSLFCEKRHCYDISRRGYVNLLMSQASSAARHGDGKDMIAARRDFLSLGLYDRISDAVTEEISRAARRGMIVLDVGCGECFYTAKTASELEKFDP
ncbi:MAG: methyltransferase, partial [Clostridia bacterium]|nr:methyltransferase [Clostridia bacterium]